MVAARQPVNTVIGGCAFKGGDAGVVAARAIDDKALSLDDIEFPDATVSVFEKIRIGDQCICVLLLQRGNLAPGPAQGCNIKLIGYVVAQLVVQKFGGANR